MKILVTFQSKTGFTKKYAEWISKELNSDLMELKKVDSEDIENYDLIIHGGWIMGGVIKGLEKIKKINPKKLIVFGVGYTSKKEVNIKQMIEDNKLNDIPFFYYEGGTDPEKMGFVGRTMVKLVTKKEVVYKDNTNKKDIKDLIKKVNNK